MTTLPQAGRFAVDRQDAAGNGARAGAGAPGGGDCRRPRGGPGAAPACWPRQRLVWPRRRRPGTARARGSSAPPVGPDLPPWPTRRCASTPGCAARYLAAGVPAVSFSPSAAAHCRDGALQSLATAPLRAALDAGLLPLVHGDVAFDAVRGGTIVSTEEVLAYLAPHLAPSWLLLAGETDGVYDATGAIVARITPDTYRRCATRLALPAVLMSPAAC